MEEPTQVRVHPVAPQQQHVVPRDLSCLTQHGSPCCPSSTRSTSPQLAHAFLGPSVDTDFADMQDGVPLCVADQAEHQRALINFWYLSHFCWPPLEIDAAANLTQMSVFPVRSETGAVRKGHLGACTYSR